MARIFTINFHLEQNIYHALVTVCTQKDNVIFDVHLSANNLNTILPDEKLSFRLSEGVFYPIGLKQDSNMELVRSTIEAIAEHLTKDEVV